MVLGSGVDGAVRRIATTYEVRGMREKITSYDSPVVGQGNVVNEVLFEYNPFGQLVTEYQSHSGAVNTTTTPKVQYGYADGADNHVRPTALTYPSGRALSYDYGPAGGMDDAASRVQSVEDGALELAKYSYLGQATFVEVDYTEPGLRYTLIDLALADDPDTGDIYTGLDRFGRVKDCRWRNYGLASDAERIKYGYDRAGNRLWRENVVADAHAADFDELYAYDGLHRLKDFDRGDLNATKDGLTTLTFAQEWSLDPTGNWSAFREDADGNTAWDLNQSRTANKVNELSDVSETVGPSWVTPVYDRAGNMTTVPKPADPTQAFTCTFDGWNRLVRIAEAGTTVAEYEYDGAKRRSVKKVYAAGQLDETRHFYYSAPDRWQVLEERIDAATTADRQFVWGLRYVDDLILRDRDTNSDGTSDQRLYALQDGNWNVAAVADSSGSVQERFAFDSYGTSAVLTPAFVARMLSSFDWENRFAGYRYDSECGFYLIRQRSYIPGLAWLQRDPLGYADALNLYEYAHNNPGKYNDPTGGPPVIVIIIVVCAFLCEPPEVGAPGPGDQIAPHNPGDVLRWIPLACAGGLVKLRSLGCIIVEGGREMVRPACAALAACLCLSQEGHAPPPPTTNCCFYECNPPVPSEGFVIETNAPCPATLSGFANCWLTRVTPPPCPRGVG
ncbi:MAG: RHS repeat-associated core domain-containing protein [Planctomycetes bacterium]|nr:RHS repeat-associated core domain-containing protein [Planctomycetota bacterium]